MLALIMAGGTGGHVYPALAVAQELQQQQHDIVWLGSKHGIEAKIVPANNILLEHISVSGLRGNGVIGWLTAPINLFNAMICAIKILSRHKPNVVIGMGGFVSGPGAVASKFLRIPLIIHEQNAIAGFTNKILRPFASLTLQAFPNTLKNAVTVGNPVRSDISQIQTKPIKKPLNILVVGGSLGAQIFNDLMPKVQHKLATQINIYHQTGRNKFASTLDKYQTSTGESLKIVEFIDDMAEAFSWADLVICRAGAMTVFELAAAGKPSILVPYPHAIDDHQTFNAKYLTEKNAAVLIPHSQLTSQAIINQLTKFIATPHQLAKMAFNSKTCHIKNSTKKMAKLCVEQSL